MKQGEKVLVYIDRVRKMASVLESMGITLDDKVKAMAVFNGFPKRFETIITAIDAIGDNDPSFTFYKAQSRLLQEKKRSSMRPAAGNAVDNTACSNRMSFGEEKPNKKALLSLREKKPH